MYSKTYVVFHILVSYFKYSYHCHGLFTDYRSSRVLAFWIASLGEGLTCDKERNPHSPFTVAMYDGQNIV